MVEDRFRNSCLTPIIDDQLNSVGYTAGKIYSTPFTIDQVPSSAILLLCYEFTNFKNKINRNFHDSGSQWIQGSLAFSDHFFFSLRSVISDNSPNALFVPTFWKFWLLHIFVRRLRRR